MEGIFPQENSSTKVMDKFLLQQYSSFLSYVGIILNLAMVSFKNHLYFNNYIQVIGVDIVYYFIFIALSLIIN